MTTLNSSAPIRVVEATTGAHLAHAAGLWLRASRAGEPWRADNGGHLLLAFAGGRPAAAAHVQPTQFGTSAILRFRAAPGADAEHLREHFIDFLGAAVAA